ncbi:MAG TPA: tetratricopeptide repeat protein [Streptosporangiaceae bacterium]|nr:tetratricopeptide repeat protein [Streptosporangiaceae bacterium]
METGDDELPGSWLRRLRETAGLTQEELAGRSGLSERAVGNLERGTGRPYPRSIRLVAAALGLSSAATEELVVRYRTMGGTRPIAANIPPSPPSPPGSSAPPGPAAVLHQLPAAIPHFAGRAAELQLLDRWLDQADGRTIAISAINGMAGVGKTTLALHWAHRKADHFPDGELYANLRGHDPSGQPASPSEVIRRFLYALGVAARQLPADLEGQTALYRSLLAGKRMLVLADNARDAAQVRPLLPGSPGSLVLVTSRSQLNGLAATDGARTLSLDVLTGTEAADLLAARLGASRMAAEPEAVAELVGLCARLPLALAIVGARAASTNWPLAAHAAELTRGVDPPDPAAGRAERGHLLDALDLGEDATDVRSVFSWSYRQLSDPAARMFRLLGMHPGPDFSAPAAASLADLEVSQAGAALRELNQVNLLIERSPGRYALHDLLHAYASELAKNEGAGEEDTAASGRMIDHYVFSAQAADRALDEAQDVMTTDQHRPGVRPERFADRDQAMAWFDAEYKTLIAMTRLAARSGAGVRTQWLAWTTVTFLDRRGFWPDLVAVQHIALAAGRRLGDLPGQARTHRNLARAYTRLGRNDRALDSLNKAVELSGRLGDKASEARAHLTIGVIHEATDNLPDSLASSLRALDLAEATEDSMLLATACNNVGYGYAALGDFAAALRYCQRAVDEHRTAGSSASLEASTWDSLGYVYHKLGNYTRAVDSYQRSLALFSEIGASYLHSKSLSRLGDTYLATGDVRAAVDAWEHALTILEDLAHPDVGQVREKLHQARAEGRIDSPAV